MYLTLLITTLKSYVRENPRRKNTAIGGFDSGLMTIQQDQTPENLIKIIFQNESLIVWDSGQGSPLVTAPDLISYLIIPEATHKRQLVYSNSDIIDPSTQQLKEELKMQRSSFSR